MAFAKKITPLNWDDGAQAWIPAPDVVLTKNSIAVATEPISAVGKTAIRLNDGSTLRVDQTLQQIEDFLNS